MSDDKKYETMMRLEEALEQIAQMHGARVDRYEVSPGNWVVSLEHEDWAVSANGTTEAQALSNLIKNAKSEGRA